jgi:hypothetical protein
MDRINERDLYPSGDDGNAPDLEEVQSVLPPEKIFPRLEELAENDVEQHQTRLVQEDKKGTDTVH